MKTTSVPVTRQTRPDNTPSRRKPTRFIVFFIGCIAFTWVVLISRPRRLSPLELQLAKHWVIPLPLNPPVTAIQQGWLFERSGRCSAHSGTLAGSWQLRGDVIEFSATQVGVAGAVKQLQYMTGQGPRPTTVYTRWKVLDITETSLTVLDLSGGPPLLLDVFTPK